MLSYPLESKPAPGTTIEVAPGVHWVRMPLPFALNHINLWALADGDAWTLVDTGLNTQDTRESWEKVFDGTMAGRPAARVICTHMHPDHVGTAGWHTRRFECPLWMTRLEYVTCRMLVADTGREAPADAMRFYRASGWDEAALEHYRSRFGGFGKLVFEMPDSYRRISDGEELSIGGRKWHAVLGRGHSPEHLCLYCPELHVLISGDQVLPKISPNVGVWPTEPEADPLALYMASLEKLRAAVPGDVLVLPSHNLPFRGFDTRIEQLLAHHEQRLDVLEDACARPHTAAALVPVLFKRELDAHQLGFAIGETLAHLQRLRYAGRVRRETRPDGVWVYEKAHLPLPLAGGGGEPREARGG
jgi:glyoxylase-like metal-dependent hydrolase (beta-lactamase superfamily II)